MGSNEKMAPVTSFERMKFARIINGSKVGTRPYSQVLRPVVAPNSVVAGFKMAVMMQRAARINTSFIP